MIKFIDKNGNRGELDDRKSLNRMSKVEKIDGIWFEKKEVKKVKKVKPVAKVEEVEEIKEEMGLDQARDAYEEKFGKPVANSMKNNLEWILKKISD